MKLRTTLLATCATAIAIAFDNQPGWKMDGDKIATDANGDPIYVDNEGREAPLKHDTVAQRGREAMQHRKRAEDAEAALKKFEVGGKLIDPTEATKAIETVKNIDAKKLIDAGEVERVKEEVRNEFAAQLTEKDTALTEATRKIDNMTIDNVFANSDFIRENVAMPRDFFEAAMRNNFKVEDGKVVAYDKAGNRLMSKKNIGEHADPQEALQLMVETHPQRDTILKAPDASGSGNGGGGGNRGGGRVMRRADFDKLAPAQQGAVAQKIAAGEMTVAD